MPGNLHRCREHVLLMRDALREDRQFSVGLIDKSKVLDANDLKAVFPGLHVNTIWPILESAIHCRVYGLRARSRRDVVEDGTSTSSASQLQAGFPQYTQLQRGYLEVNLNAVGLGDDVGFWWRVTESLAQTLVVVETSRLDAKAVFESMYNPLPADALGGLHALPQSYARRVSLTKGRSVIVLDAMMSDLGAFVFAAPDDVERLFESAVAHARLTEQYLNMFCTIRTRPFDTGGWVFYRNEVVEAGREYMAVLVAALQDGEGNPGDGSVAARALTAAELVAALGGCPPVVFSESDDSAHRRAVNWVAWARRTTGEPPGDVVSLAHRAVIAISGIPHLAEQAWKTDEARQQWRETIADLEARLSSLQV